MVTALVSPSCRHSCGIVPCVMLVRSPLGCSTPLALIVSMAPQPQGISRPCQCAPPVSASCRQQQAAAVAFF